MLKKILAASTAGVLALAAMASSAMAADDNTIVFENVVENETVTLELTNELTKDDMMALLGQGTGADCADPEGDSGNSYSNIVLSAWIKQMNGDAGTGVMGVGKDGKTTGTYYKFNDSKKDITFGGATVNAVLQGSMKEYVVIGAGKTIPADAPQEWLVEYGFAAGDQLAAPILLPKGTKGGAAGFNTTFTAADAANKEKGEEAKEWKQEVAIAKDVSWLNSTGTAGYATSPAGLQASFGASATNVLQSINYDKSSVKMSFTVSMPADMFRGMVTTVSGNSWNWSGATWNSALISEILNSQAGKDTINNYFGIVGESGTVSNGNFTRKGGVSSNNQTKVVKADYETKTSKKALPNHGRATVGLGINATPTRLKNLNNGGTITFEFNKDMWNGVFADVEVIFRAASGQVKYPLATDYKWSEDGKSITVPLPAGLTYNEQLNSFNSFSFEYKVGTAHTGNLVDLGNNDNNIGQWWGNNPTFWDAVVNKITITANKEAPKPDDSSNSGGLVSSGDSTSTSTPSSNTNSGSNNGEKNPGTGVAVAVAPVVLAAAGAAVVISKKRK